MPSRHPGQRSVRGSFPEGLGLGRGCRSSSLAIQRDGNEERSTQSEPASRSQPALRSCSTPRRPSGSAKIAFHIPQGSSRCQAPPLCDDATSTSSVQERVTGISCPGNPQKGKNLGQDDYRCGGHGTDRYWGSTVLCPWGRGSPEPSKQLLLLVLALSLGLLERFDAVAGIAQRLAVEQFGNRQNLQPGIFFAKAFGLIKPR